jgi:hypothetical protein
MYAEDAQEEDIGNPFAIFFQNLSQITIDSAHTSVAASAAADSNQQLDLPENLFLQPLGSAETLQSVDISSREGFVEAYPRWKRHIENLIYIAMSFVYYDPDCMPVNDTTALKTMVHKHAERALSWIIWYEPTLSDADEQRKDYLVFLSLTFLRFLSE